ncbi:tyrosine recombinase XerD [Desulforapulum autotrophicum HRM2]|uniref:Tyrosine recombinase XerD n=1 Tax=Desulforapulum autotrophicum (strain ATCC 43914 / DSM 3382 / VKM B-1955 / HRM2) TaxID=177437 RepID=C0QB39_DESAH|nr:site-specific integrase [Desulforapulum autotrophicum]ACN14838.1 tyrosine recombinase XerD [Desulforapulum autotrophicum HRM2]
MAINIRCQKCKTDCKLGSKKCSSCGSPFPKNKKYRVIVRANGKRIIRTVNNLELARDIEGKLQGDIVRGEFDIEKPKSAITLQEVWEKYLPWVKVNKKTWLNDQYHYNHHLKPVFADNPLDTISPFDIEKFMVTMKKGKSKRGKPYAAATIKHQVVLLTRLYSVAEQWGLYSGDNPCKKVKKPKLNNQVTEFLTDDELNSLLDVLEKWHNKMSAGFILFCLHTGLRRGELFKLTWENVDLTRQSMVLKDPKGKLDQTLPLSDKAVEVLNSLPKDYKTQWIFYGKDGKQRTDFKGPWDRIKVAAGLPKDFRLHGLRHHFASALVSAGVDLYTVQKLLCHKDAAMTQRYAHLADKTLRDAVNLSDSLLEKKEVAQVVNMEAFKNAK